MRIDFHVFIHQDSESAILAALAVLNQGVAKMAAEFDALVTKVTAIEDAGDAMIVVLNDVAQRLRDMAAGNPTPAEIQALADRLTAQTQEIVDATVANTPAE